MTYASHIWGQFADQHMIRFQNIQNKALRNLDSSDIDASATLFDHKSDILKLLDHVCLQNFLHVHRDLKENSLPSSLQNSFNITNANRRYPNSRLT